LPGKNIRPFAGLPLIGHSIKFSKLCPEITRCIVSTESPEIAEIGRSLGGDVPFMRPTELAQDETPMLPVLTHSLKFAEEQDGQQYDLLILLDPTSPAREPVDVSGAMRRLLENSEADGIIGVSQPEFNPISHCVVEEKGWMTDLIDGGSRFTRRQDEPPVYWINGALYIWRTGFLRNESDSWRNTDKLLVYEMPQHRAMSIDSELEFQRAELMVKHGMITFPWLKEPHP
jgi:N-acylneuraminate cytidylyltransferase